MSKEEKFQNFIQGVVDLKAAAHKNEKVNFSGLHKRCNSFIDALRKFRKTYTTELTNNLDSDGKAKLKKDIQALTSSLQNVISKVGKKQSSGAIAVASALSLLGDNVSPEPKYKSWAGYLSDTGENDEELITFANVLINAKIPEPKPISAKLKNLFHKATK